MDRDCREAVTTWPIPLDLFPLDSEATTATSGEDGESLGEVEEGAPWHTGKAGR